jgi:hypothetical protein
MKVRMAGIETVSEMCAGLNARAIKSDADSHCPAGTRRRRVDETRLPTSPALVSGGSCWAGSTGRYGDDAISGFPRWRALVKCRPARACLVQAKLGLIEIRDPRATPGFRRERIGITIPRFFVLRGSISCAARVCRPAPAQDRRAWTSGDAHARLTARAGAAAN